jgi:cytochrome c
MKLTIATTLAVASLATAAFAEGDAAKGEKTYKKCKACHAITDAEGNNIVKGGKTGPNLYGVIGRTAGTYDGFAYGADIVKAGEAGLVWDEATFTAYVQDPKAFLSEYLDDAGARSKMSFKLRKDMEDVYAYLVSVAE